MQNDPKSPQDIERIKRVLYLLFNSDYSLNYYEKNPRKDLSLFKLKLEVTKSEKLGITFRKAPRAKGMTDVILALGIHCPGSKSDTLSKARLSNEEAAKFEIEIRQKYGYVLKEQSIEDRGETYREYKLL